ncbi:MAG: cytochrome b/b6 domain-containing protein [Pseudomonadota bacterium]
MSETERVSGEAPFRLVWDWPLRIWHWAFAVSVTFSLVTGLSGRIALMDWHLRSGYVVLGLLLFRFGWALWGGRYARFASFRSSPAKIVAHFRGAGVTAPRTAPGAALAGLLILAVAGQAASGLFTTDDIFTEGPLVRYAGDSVVAQLSTLHRQAFWGVLALVAVHLTAQAVYAARRDPTPLSMFTGRKRVAAAPVRHRPVRALLTAAAAAAALWWALQVL